MRKLEDYSGRDRTRFLVRKRDKFRCTKCGKNGLRSKRQFHVHHLNNLCGKMSRAYDRVADISGLTTLCPACHLGMHTVRKKMSVGHTKRTSTKKVVDVEFILLVARKTRRVDIAKHFGVTPQSLTAYYKKHFSTGLPLALKKNSV